MAHGSLKFTFTNSGLTTFMTALNCIGNGECAILVSCLHTPMKTERLT